jgi:lipopolysaccharide export system protein LptA
MSLLALLLMACAGHADPPEQAPKLQVQGAVVTLPDGSELSAEAATLSSEGLIEATGVKGREGTLEIEAPITSWDLKNRTASLSGGVVARRGPVRVQCAEMVVTLSGPGRVEQAVAKGDVRITHGKRVGRSRSALLSTADGRIVLTGSPVLRDGANQMTGSRIVLFLDEERVVCDDCRLQIDPEAVAPRRSEK